MYKSFTEYLKENKITLITFKTFHEYVTHCISAGFQCYHYYDLLLGDETLGEAFDKICIQLARGNTHV